MFNLIRTGLSKLGKGTEILAETLRYGEMLEGLTKLEEAEKEAKKVLVNTRTYLPAKPTSRDLTIVAKAEVAYRKAIRKHRLAEFEAAQRADYIEEIIKG